jgi:23S rRNA pseudouridine955/2504/2580 synthase/23S rRNA pseudouridine1911/1915/1917 synthase
MNIEVLFEDADLLAINKPAGVLSVPDRWDKEKENLVAILQSQRPGQYLANVHRLDRNTSGTFLLAKNTEAFRRVARQLRERSTRKLYLALVLGDVVAPERVIELPIGPHPKRAGLVRIDERNGKPARSIVRLKEKFRGFAFVEVEIESGRQHQVRVHCQAIGHPLVGDADYGGRPLLLSQIKRKYRLKEGREERPLMGRPALHAASLTLAAPPLTITAPMPKDFTVSLKYLRMFAGM